MKSSKIYKLSDKLKSIELISTKNQGVWHPPVRNLGFYVKLIKTEKDYYIYEYNTREKKYIVKVHENILPWLLSTTYHDRSNKITILNYLENKMKGSDINDT